MTPTKALAGTAIVFGAVLSVLASTPGAQAPQTAPGAPAAGDPAAARGAAPAGAQAPGGAQGGRAGGRGNPTAALFTEQCAGCHGSDLAGGRAPSLFDPKWLDSVDDNKIVNGIKNGVPNTEMEGFGKSLNDAQIWSLVQYIRTQTGALKPKPAFIADPNGQVLKTEKATVKVEVLSKDLNTPFGMAFLPDGRLLITERNGTLRIWNKGALSEPVKNTPKVHVQQDGGLLDVTVHPQYGRNGWVYLSYSEDQPGYVAPPPPAPGAAPAAAPGGAAPGAPAARGGGAPTGDFGAGAGQPGGGAPGAGGPGGGVPGAGGPQAGGGRGGRGGAPQVPSMTVVVRGKINKNNEWTDNQVIWRVDTKLYTTAGAHYGSRFAWDKQNHLFFTIGERGQQTNAQDLSIPLGKIHRFNDDGTAPKDNPFVGKEGAIPTIWTYGHRNPEGLAWDPVTGKMWETEHGPSGGDEVNIIEKGHNYGWGVASKGTQPGITKTSEAGMDDPIVYYTPAIGPAQITFYSGNRYPGWKNTSLFVSGLVGQKLLRLEIAGDKVTKQETLFDGYGRVRYILQGPDGYLYIALQDPTGIPGVSLSAATPGKLIRLMPAQ